MVSQINKKNAVNFLRSTTVKSLASIAVLSTLSAGIAEAANFTTFTDRADWEAAVGSFSEEDFNDFTTEVSFEQSSLDVGDFTLVGLGSRSFGRNFIDVPPAQFSVFNIDGTPNVNALAFFSDATRLDFDSPITAFGADFAAISNGFFTTEFVIGSDAIDIPDTPLGFFGFVSDMSFSEILFQGTGDGFSFDNVVYGQVSTPEPASILGLLAFGAIGGSMLKRK
ncbi:MAG: PEP-CTERM sorting domain-containing protein [Okeania sp. SIO2F4]|uniref:PEP-CTERM sorting domain-containing protein n=1 Tax=Okeania sp. SIO2F4 TaxID=2607790 RepID=UPI00142A5CB2|nr:PEP-CTERM sorting domain-containing protein [Okeania sp. SIO2F4]NES04638.1 PEP-CTERM sorting domain-containing protein [Okeania sp. SIO2F4]